MVHAIRVEKKLSIRFQEKYPSCIWENCTIPPEDLSDFLPFMKLNDHYSAWTIEEKLLEAVEQYGEEKDREIFQETIENLRFL